MHLLSALLADHIFVLWFWLFLGLGWLWGRILAKVCVVGRLYVSFKRRKGRQEVTADDALEFTGVSCRQMFVQIFLFVGFERTTVGLKSRFSDGSFPEN